MVKRRILFLIVVVLLFYVEGAMAKISPSAAPSPFSPLPKVRVKIKEKQKNIFISGINLKRKIHVGRRTRTFEGQKMIRFNCMDLDGGRGRKIKKPVLLASLTSSTGVLSLWDEGEREKYRGLLHIVASPHLNSCNVVHEVDFRDYLASLLAKEMNGQWPIEALKAQAVAARTYALFKMKSRQVVRQAGFETFYHLENSEKHQVGGHLLDSTEKTRKASLDTLGEVLFNSSDELQPLFYHAKCGGQTLNPHEVWSHSVGGYRSVGCPSCREKASPDYETRVSKVRFKKFLNWLVKKDLIKPPPGRTLSHKISLASHENRTRKLGVYWGDQLVFFKKSLLRRYFGRVIVPSNNFKVELKGSQVLLKGSGRGHGVGMCQLGALHLARRGWDYKKILSYYFPHFKMKRIY